MLLRRPLVTSSSDALGTFPAPIRGLNLRDGLAAMKSQDATILENYFPEATTVRLRRGRTSFSTIYQSPVETLMEWAGPAGTKFFSASGTSIYDITAGGTHGAASLSGLVNARFDHVQMTNSGGDAFLVICNGATGVRNFDGTNWTTPTINNVTSSTLIGVALFKHRLWFVQANSMSAWYLDIDSIAGDATEFALGSVFRKGGKLQMIGSLSQDSGDGIDDYIAFFSSNGEIAVYQGIDPDDADNFNLIGRFEVGRPVGDRALLRVGGDLAMIGTDGAVSVLQMMRLDRASSNKASISNRVDAGLAEAFRLYGGNTGWQAVTYPRGHMAIVNVPQSTTRFWQYVMNTQTGGWCKFTGHNAHCWGLFNDELYFGGATAVYKAESGYSDAGSPIVGRWRPAFQSFGSARKHFKMVRPLYRTNVGAGVAIILNADYDERIPTVAEAVTGSGQSLWGSSAWGATVWGAAATNRTWRSCLGSGFVAAPHVLTSTDDAFIEFDAIDVMYERARGSGT